MAVCLRVEVEALKAKQDSLSALNTPRFNEMAEQTLKVNISAPLKHAVVS